MKNEEIEYATPVAKTVEIDALSVICQSGGSEAYGYSDENTDNWF